MIDKSFAARCAAGVLGGLLLVNVGAAAHAEVTANGSDDVDVKVDIAPTQNGALSLTVAGTQTTLSEQTGTADYREFTGALPTVTVTDTRTDVPEGLSWYVMGQASEFAGSNGQPAIDSSHLGWVPAMVSSNNGEVAEGQEVKSELDGGEHNVGLKGEELLALALDSDKAKAVAGQWQVGAELKLKTPVTVAPGSYTSVLTLSLFEDKY